MIVEDCGMLLQLCSFGFQGQCWPTPNFYVLSVFLEYENHSAHSDCLSWFLLQSVIKKKATALLSDILNFMEKTFLLMRGQSLFFNLLPLPINSILLVLPLLAVLVQFIS